MPTPETELRNICYKILDKLGGTYRTFGNFNHGQYKNKKGTFDSLIAYRGKMFWVEWKIRPRKMSPEQIEFQRWLFQNGQKGYVVYGVSEFAKIINFIERT